MTLSLSLVHLCLSDHLIYYLHVGVLLDPTRDIFYYLCKYGSNFGAFFGDTSIGI